MFKATGVTITSQSDHIQFMCFKSRRLVGLLHHQFYNGADSNPLLSVQPAIATCHVSGHILSMHAQSGTSILLMRLPNCRICQCLLSITIRYAAHLDSRTMRTFWHIWIYHLSNEGSYSWRLNDAPFCAWQQLHPWSFTTPTLPSNYSTYAPILLFHIMLEQMQFFFPAHATLW